MYVRKIQQTGGASYIITLPKEWVLQRNLKVGDNLVLTPQEDGTIFLQSQVRKKERKKFVVKVDKMQPEHLLRKLISLYMMARGDIELKSEDRMRLVLRQTARDTLKRLIGYEIVEETSNSIIIQDILDPVDLSIPKSFKRMSLLASTMFNDSIAAIIDSNKMLAKDIIDRDDEVDRLQWLICKQFNLLLIEPSLAASMEIRPAEAVHYRAAGKNIERIADHSCRIAHYLQETGRLSAPLSRSIQELSLIVEGILNDAVRAFTKKDFELANNVIEEMNLVAQTRTRIMKQIRRGSKAIVNLAYIIDSVERVASYSTDIAEVAIDLTALSN
jgi:phosphate uptake regulator